MTTYSDHEQRLLDQQSGADLDRQTALRVKAGWQCPECYSVNVTRHMTRFAAQPIGFNCQECGCQWGSQ